RVADGKLHEVADLPQVRRVGVGDDVEAGPAAGIAGLDAERADAGAARLVDVVVARVERSDDELAPDVELHVLVLPVAVRPEDFWRLEGVEQAWRGGVADVVGLEAVPSGGDEDVSPGDAVELALDDHRRV